MSPEGKKQSQANVSFMCIFSLQFLQQQTNFQGY